MGRGFGGEACVDGGRVGIEDREASGGVEGMGSGGAESGGETLGGGADGVGLAACGGVLVKGVEDGLGGRAVDVFADGHGGEVGMVRGRFHGISWGAGGEVRRRWRGRRVGRGAGGDV